LDQAKRQAQEYKISLKEETWRLVIHGLLHLLGYDHKSQRQAEIMKDKEKAYLNWSAGQKPSSKITKSYETY
jgi:probable rRNA maturation factor